MVKKVQKSAAGKKTASPLPSSVKDSAQQIWLAGLGAFTKAQTEGGKVFETLVKEGLAIQRKTQAWPKRKITEATSKMAHVATGLTSKATGQWDKLESIFEERVARALNKLGVPSAKDVEALVARIDELNRSVQRLSAKAAPARKAGATAVKPAAKAPAKPRATAKAPAKKATTAAKTPRRAAAKKVVAEAVPAAE